MDIGTGSGVAARILRKNGWDVTAVDPSLDETSVGHHLGEFEGVHLYPATLQKLPVELNDTFDIAVYCHFLIPYAERESFFQRLAQLMKTGSVVYLFFAEDDYDILNYGGKLSQLMQNYFKVKSLIQKNEGHGRFTEAQLEKTS